MLQPPLQRALHYPIQGKLAARDVSTVLALGILRLTSSEASYQHGTAHLRRGAPAGMGDMDVRQHAGRTRRGGGPAFDLVVSKLRRPVIRPGTISRSSLIERLAQDDARPI